MPAEVIFNERGGNTLVTVKWLPLDSTPEERQTFDQNHEGMKMGWGGTLVQLEAYLAGATPTV